MSYDIKYKGCGADNTRLPRKFMHPKDVKAREADVMGNKRDRWRAEHNVPPERVYQAIGDVPGGREEVGVNNTYVTQSSNSKIVWNPKTKHWEMASYSQVAPQINKLVRIVSSGQRGNRQGGGSF